MRVLFALIASGVLALWLGAGYWHAQTAGARAAEEPLGPIQGAPLDPSAGGAAAGTPAPSAQGSPGRGVLGASSGAAPAAGAQSAGAGAAASRPASAAAGSVAVGEPQGAEQPAPASQQNFGPNHVSIAQMAIDGPELEPGVKLLSFSDLALPDYRGEPNFDEGDRPAATQIFPAPILALDGTRVALDGFMQPLDFKGRQVTAFVLSPSPPGCCFGAMPRLDEWLDSVVLDPEGAPFYGARPIRCVGHLRVGEAVDEFGYVTSIYRMDVERIDKLW